MATIRNPRLPAIAFVPGPIIDAESDVPEWRERLEQRRHSRLRNEVGTRLLIRVRETAFDGVSTIPA